jgi:hypothetical protein
MQSGEEWQRLKKNFIRGINDDVRPSINLNKNLLYFDGKIFFLHMAVMKIHSFRYCCLEMQLSVSICYPNRISRQFHVTKP